MAKLVALKSETHGDMRLNPNRATIYAAAAHMLPLRVTEVAQAIVDFPVMMSRMSNGDMSLSMLASFEPGRNLFIGDNVWNSGFQPAAMKTYPVFLMRAEDGGSEPVLGVDDESQALGRGEGESLFDKKGKPSLTLKNIQAQLLEDSQNRVHTFQFFETLKAFNLIRSVDLILNYEDGEMNRIRGLSMIHEDNLQALASERLTELRDKGYLAPIYAMLFSVFQLNALIRRNNMFEGLRAIKSINLEVSKDSHLV